jgi:hypothetical protein
MRWLKLTGLLLLSWCVMVFSHEAGHIIGGWLCGAVLRDADLRPWALPHSRFDPDPYPLVTLWAGPILGAVFPVAAAAAIKRRWAWFVANFCLLANGVYLALGWISGGPHLDTSRLLAEGAAPVQIAIYCALTILLGYPRFRAGLIDVLSPTKD